MPGDSYHAHLASLSKEELVKLLYTKKKKAVTLEHKSYRTIAIRISYDGRGYSGVQRHTGIRSIEDELHSALLLGDIGEGAVFCGRTDAGVSAIKMVASLRVKSRLSSPNRGYARVESDRDEYPYDMMINERLPPDIRVTGWAPVPDDFSARHSCIQRYYRYYFTLKNMNIARIHEAAKRIREMTNFYKLSTHSNPRAIYDRVVDSLWVEKVTDEPHGVLPVQRSEWYVRRPRIPKQDDPSAPEYNDLYCIHISARSFLHNMVRKIAWLIQSYASGNEFSLEQVRIAPPEPLVFMEGKYRQELQFSGNRFSRSTFEKAYDDARMVYVLAKLRLNGYEE